MTDHPLRPATRLRLGGPLPRQLADRPRAHPRTPGRFRSPAFLTASAEAVVSSSISTPFGMLSQIRGQVTHVLLTRAPLYSTRRPFAFDLHVLGAPPTFALSQDQTLQLNLESSSSEIPKGTSELPLQRNRLETCESSSKHMLFSCQRPSTSKSSASQRCRRGGGHCIGSASLSTLFSSIRVAFFRDLLSKKPQRPPLHSVAAIGVVVPSDAPIPAASSRLNRRGREADSESTRLRCPRFFLRFAEPFNPGFSKERALVTPPVRRSTASPSSSRAAAPTHPGSGSKRAHPRASGGRPCIGSFALSTTFSRRFRDRRRLPFR